jgi:Zn-dependent alcohol dehydrogenase
VGCSFLTAYGTIINDVTPNNLDNVLLIGGGGISQALVIVLRCLGIENIEVVEPNLERRNYLKSIGAKVTYPSTSDIPHSSRFFSAVIEMTGLTKEIEFGYESLVQNGTIALIGVTKANEKILIDPMPLHYGKKIVGVYGGGVKPDKDIFALLDLFKRDELILSKLQYKELSLDQINQGIEAMQNTTFPGRVIIRMSK